MPFQPADSISLVAFESILGMVVLSFILGTIRSAKNQNQNPVKPALFCGAIVFFLILVTSIIVNSGVLEAQPFPRVPVFFVFCNLTALVLSLSPAGKWLATGLSIRALIAFQVFRLPLELVLHTWAKQGTIPETMTWSGSNFDIFTGALALLTPFLVTRVKMIGWVFNGIGLALLLNVMRVAVLSSPFDFAWSVTPPLVLAFYLPYAWIIPICVSGALFGHVVLTRALLKTRT